MPNIRFTRKLQRIVGQIRFKPTLSSWDNTLKTAKLLESQYPEWRLQSEAGSIVLINREEKKLFKIEYNALTILSDDKKASPSDLIQQIKKIYKEIVEDSDVKEIQHVGLRNIQALETPFDFEELVAINFEKLFSPNESLKSISVDEVLDTSFVLEGKKNGIRNRVKIGSTRKDEAIKYLSGTFDLSSEIKEMDGESYLYLDVDVHSNKIDSTEVIQFLESAIVENKRIIDEYLDYFLQ